MLALAPDTKPLSALIEEFTAPKLIAPIIQKYFVDVNFCLQFGYSFKVAKGEGKRECSNHHSDLKKI